MCFSLFLGFNYYFLIFWDYCFQFYLLALMWNHRDHLITKQCSKCPLHYMSQINLKKKSNNQQGNFKMITKFDTLSIITKLTANIDIGNESLQIRSGEEIVDHFQAIKQ